MSGIKFKLEKLTMEIRRKVKGFKIRRFNSFIKDLLLEENG